MDVELYVYDLSRGLARQFSSQLLGTYIDAVYHTSVVFGGVEIFFGLGVQTSAPGSTHHGAPMEIIPLGRTSLPTDVIEDYVMSLREIYTAESYDLFLHNCNNFSNDLAMFLVGKGIHPKITSLPQTVLNTPFGQMLKPQLDSAMRSMTQAPSPPSSAPAAAVSRSVLRLATNGTRSAGPTQGPRPEVGLVQNITGLSDLLELLGTASTRCAVIFFTSSSCAPCKIVYPAYDELAAEAGNRAIFIKVDIRHAYGIAAQYRVRATPTFITFLRGEKENEWTGADESRLRGKVGLLLQMAQHPHRRLTLPILLSTPRRFLTYTKVPPLEKLMGKMGEASRDQSVQAMKNFVVTRNTEGSSEAPVPDLEAFSVFLQRVTMEMPEDVMFTVVDLLRTALVDPRVSGFFAEEGNGHRTLRTVLDYVNQPDSGGRPYALRLVTLQMLCNMFTSSLFATYTLADASLVSRIVQLENASLSDPAHENVRISAASLIFDVALAVYAQRADGNDPTLAEADQLQLVVALVDAITSEHESVDALKRNLLALGLLVYCAPMEGDLLDYVKAADVAALVKNQAKIFPKERLILELSDELLSKGVQSTQ